MRQGKARGLGTRLLQAATPCLLNWTSSLRPDKTCSWVRVPGVERGRGGGGVQAAVDGTGRRMPVAGAALTRALAGEGAAVAQGGAGRAQSVTSRPRCCTCYMSVQLHNQTPARVLSPQWLVLQLGQALRLGEGQLEVIRVRGLRLACGGKVGQWAQETVCPSNSPSNTRCNTRNSSNSHAMC